MAVWIEEGCAVAAGRRRSRAASTATRSSSKNGGSFIATGNRRAARCVCASRFGLPLGIEWLGGHLAIGFLEEDFLSAFCFLHLFLSLSGMSTTFLVPLHDSDHIYISPFLHALHTSTT